MLGAEPTTFNTMDGVNDRINTGKITIDLLEIALCSDDGSDWMVVTVTVGKGDDWETVESDWPESTTSGQSYSEIVKSANTSVNIHCPGTGNSGPEDSKPDSLFAPGLGDTVQFSKECENTIPKCCPSGEQSGTYVIDLMFEAYSNKTKTEVYNINWSYSCSGTPGNCSSSGLTFTVE